MLLIVTYERITRHIACRCRAHRLSTAVRVVYNLSVNLYEVLCVFKTREERKMEAIMKAFERLEKAEQRRQENQAKQAVIATSNY